MINSQLKKIAFVSPIEIFPPQSGGQLRSATLCRSLSQLGFEVRIYSFTGKAYDYLKFKSSFQKEIGSRLYEYVNMAPIWGLLLFLFDQLRLPPFWMTLITQFYIPKSLRICLDHAEIIIVDTPYLYPILKNMLKTTSKAKILNTHNIEYELWKKRTLFSPIVKSIELKSYRTADQVLFCNSTDKLTFSSQIPDFSNKSYVVPNGVDIDRFVFSTSIRKQYRDKLGLADSSRMFLFTGSHYEPNKEAFSFIKSFAKKFAKELKLLRVTLVVVGTVSNEYINTEHFKVLGKVEDIMPYLWAADFGINPIIIGSGVNIKMIEFLAAKIPILSSPFGCRGLRLIDKVDCITFHRSNLLEAIHYAIQLKPYSMKKMAESAFYKNYSSIDMKIALREIWQNPSVSEESQFLKC